MEKNKKFCSEGITGLSMCAYCGSVILSENQVKTMVAAIEAHLIRNDKKRSDILLQEIFNVNPLVRCVNFYICGNEEIAQLLSHRLIVYPLCACCEVNFGHSGLADIAEQRIVLALRTAPREKMSKEESDGLCQNG